jgi:hypothetical protein
MWQAIISKARADAASQDTLGGRFNNHSLCSLSFPRSWIDVYASGCSLIFLKESLRFFEESQGSYFENLQMRGA